MTKNREVKATDSSGGIEMTPSLVYLFLYNLIQAVGWTGVSVLALFHYGAHNSCDELYADVKLPLNIFQTLALLEVVHAAVGLVRSNPILTGFQVMSRVTLIWGVLYLVPESQKQVGVPLILIAWCVTEIIRYTFYMMALVGDVPYVLQWARYTLFIVLYPLGVTGELLSMYSALTPVRDRGIMSVRMPNRVNMSFNYYYILIITMMLYVPVFPQLYLHMFGQRKKVLGEPERLKKD